MAEPHACPGRDDLQQMILNRLPGEAAQRIQRHVEACAKCRHALEQCLASDELLDAVRAGRGPSSDPTKTIYLPADWIRGAPHMDPHPGHDSRREKRRCLFRPQTSSGCSTRRRPRTKSAASPIFASSAFSASAAWRSSLRRSTAVSNGTSAEAHASCHRFQARQHRPLSA